MKSIEFSKPNLPRWDSVKDKIKSIYKSGDVTNRSFRKALEILIETDLGVKHAIAFNSCTTGLILCLRALGLPKDATIGVPDFTWFSTKKAVEWCGYNVKYIDINRETFLIEDVPDDVDAVIPVHVFGNRCKVEADVPVIYDAAPAYGMPGLGKDGLASVISFSPRKTTTGIEGGVVITNNDEFADRIRSFQRYAGRMSEINAMVAIENIKRKDEILKRKKEIYEYYRKNLSGDFQKITESNYDLIGWMAPEGFADYVYNRVNELKIRQGYDQKTNLPNTTYVNQRVFRIPTFCDVDEEEVVKCITKYL